MLPPPSLQHGVLVPCVRSGLCSNACGAPGTMPEPLGAALLTCSGSCPGIGKWARDYEILKPWPPCREVLLRRAGSAEGFLGMRRTYQASLAAIAATGYISGSGDRHMDNYLLSSATGALVPIDFGCAALLMAA